MCKKSILVKNPALLTSLDAEGGSNGYNYIPFYSRSSMYVGCGYCYQCQQIKNNEWQLRLRYEMDSTNRAGGYVFKEELTYCDEKVSKIGNFMVFNKEHVQQFLKLLRIRISRSGYNCKLKYFLCCEYGSHCTHRPHYHVLFFLVGDKIPSVSAFNRLVAESWQYGYTNQNKGRNRKPNWTVHDKVVKSFAGVEYVTKYLFKDVNFYDGLVNQSSKNVYNYVCKSLSVSSLDLSDDDTFVKVVKCLRHSVYKDVIPFKMQSQGIGVSMLEKLTFDDVCTGVFNDTLTSKLAYIPTYYKRKLVYDYNKLTRCFVKSEQYINWLHQKELNSDHSFEKILDGLELSPELKFQYNTFVNNYSDEQLYYYFYVYRCLSDCAPVGKFPNLSVSPWNIQSTYENILRVFRNRDLFYSGLLRITFNINDLMPLIPKVCIDEFEKYTHLYFVDGYERTNFLCRFFIQLENYIRECKNDKGKMICKNIHETYVANRYDYRCYPSAGKRDVVTMSLPF